MCRGSYVHDLCYCVNDMKVLLLAENWPPRVGGIEAYLVGISKYLREKTLVVAPHVSDAPKSEIRNPNVEIIRKKFFEALIRPKWLGLFIFVWKLVGREKVEVVLCGKALFEGLVGYYLKKYLGVPYVVFTYAMEIETWIKIPRERRKLERVLRAANKVAYINEHTKDQLVKLGVRPEQLLQLWPGVETPVVSRKQLEEARERLNLPQLYVLSVGRLIERKGFDVLIEAFSRLPAHLRGWKLVIAGSGSLRKKLEDKARELGIENSVQFLGYVSDIDLQAAYANASVFALLPKYIGGDVEGFGIVYLEAALHGVPSLATQGGGAAEAVVHNETGMIVAPNSVTATTTALTRLLSDTDLRQRLGQAAQRRAQEEFTWSRRIMPLRRTLESL